MSAGIKASTNKFAFLHVQDSSEESDSSEKITSQKNNAKVSTAKKSNAADSSNAKKKSRRRKKKNSSSAQDSNQGGDSQLQDWVQHDRELVDNLYDEDLRRAIELSKVEFEKSQNERRFYVQSMSMDIPHQNNMRPGTEKENAFNEFSKSASPPKKERKKNKTTKTISLEEFHQHVENSLPLQDGESLMSERRSENKAPEDTSNFFEEVDKAASYVKRNEHVIPRLNREHDKKSKTKPEKSNKRDQQQQVSAEKDQLIEKLQDEVKNWEQQFKHVKKRNKQLLVMLQQGEMKDKSELLLEIERLTILRDELTQEVSNLNESLEQERSRSRKLRDEVLKLQGKRAHEDA